MPNNMLQQNYFQARIYIVDLQTINKEHFRKYPDKNIGEQEIYYGTNA